MPLPNPPTIIVRGPFWTAQVTVVSETLASSERAVRQTRSIFVRQGDLRAGTINALCFVHRVEIRPDGSGGYVWQRAGGAQPPPSSAPDDVHQAKASGELVPLMLVAQEQSNEYRCVGGDICLDVLPAQAGADDKLYQALGLQRSSQPVRGRWELSAHASGVSLHSLFRLPWIDDQLRAPLLLAPAIRRDGETETRGYRLSIEEERLTEGEAYSIILAWQLLTRYLNPRNALVPGNPELPVPTWVTLETADPLDVPQIYWKIEDWTAPLPRPLFAGSDAFNLILSDQQPDEQVHKPASLATVALEEVAFEGDLEAGLTLSLVTGQDADGSTNLQYAWDNADGLRDTLDITELEVAFSPVETPEMLREQLGILPPEWFPSAAREAIAPPVVWGFMPLDEGWAQLPVLNLTEQIFLNAELANLAQDNAPQPRSLIQGAVSLGNAHSDVLVDFPHENPWNVTLIRAQRVQGTWKLQPAGDNELQLQSVAVRVDDPEVILNGFFWLSTGQPTIEDALPDLDDWGSGLEAIPLRTNQPTRDLFPAPVIFQTSEISLKLRTLSDETRRKRTSAELMDWDMQYRVQDAVLEKMLQRCILPLDVFSAAPPLLWLRHQTLPMIQALPLTQTKTPPNHPNASRQLAPFQLPLVEQPFEAGRDCAADTSPGETPVVALPDGWRFGVAAGNGADQWAQVLLGEAPLKPAREWVEEQDLPLVALSLPGLILDPYLSADEIGLGEDSLLTLALQMRYDLPYTDQLNALAELPKEETGTELSSPLAPEEPEGQPAPLQRADYGKYWHSLSIKASLASVAAADVFRRENGNTSVQNLVEPYRWLVAASSDLNAYPGSLQVDNADGEPLPIQLSEDAALEGLSGRFIVEGDENLVHSTNGDGNPYYLTAGSAAAYVTGEGAGRQYRDQRGLLRGATRLNVESPALLRTPVKLHREIGAYDHYELVTALGAQSLSIGAGQWSFWFRDLPAQQATDTFLRRITQSDFAEDINDPEALASHYNHLNGYEWRLGASDAPHLPLFNLHFFPLSLEEVAFDGETVQRVVLIGRLQLPLDADNPAEITDLSNAVQLTFEQDAAAGMPVLSAVEIISSRGEWPLRLRDGETTNAPLLTWESVTLDADAGQLTVSGVQLRYILFDAEWTLPLDDLLFASDTISIEQVYTFAAAVDAPIAPRDVQLTLKTDGDHSATLNLDLRLGDRNAAADDEAVRRAFSTTIQVELVQGGDNPYSAVDAMLFEDVPIQRGETEADDDLELIYTDKAFQLRWYDFQRPQPVNGEAQQEHLQLLPGLHLMHPDTTGSGLPGFVAASFHVLRQVALPAGFNPQAGDALDTLRAALTQVHVSLPSSSALQQVGNGQHWHLRHDTHTDVLRQTGEGWMLFFGIPHLQMRMAFVEMLINCAWGNFLQDGVGAYTASDDQREQIFSSSAGFITLNYTTRWRDQDDTWQDRYLLNGVLEVTNLVSWPAGIIPDADDPMQLQLPAAALGDEPLSHTRHTLRVLLNQHEMPPEALIAGDENLIFALAPGHSWQFLAVVEHQLIDVATNADFTEFNLSNDRRWTALQEVRLMLPETFAEFLGSFNTQEPDHEQWVMNYGYLSEDLRRAFLQEEVGELARLRYPALLVEASAPHWVRLQPLSEALGTTDLQYLPGGAQNAILSAPEDFAPVAISQRTDDPVTADEMFRWLLLTMPFLGRLQDRRQDRLDVENLPPDEEVSDLQIDPVLQLYARLRADVSTTDDIESALQVSTAAIFANVSLTGKPLNIRIAVMDTAAGHIWARLDQLSLEENWYRVQNPLAERVGTGIRGVMASLPDTPARLSRSTALRHAFETFRRVSVPAGEDAQPLIPDTTGQLVWREGHLFLLQGVEAERKPVATTNLIPYVVKEGDTLFAISRRFETTVDDIRDANPDEDLSVIHAGDKLQIPLPFAVRSEQYVVQSGDTIIVLWRRYARTSSEWNEWRDAFVLANQIQDPDLILTRQVVWIPVLGGASTDGDTGEAGARPLQLCWDGNPSGSSKWKIHNPNPKPLSLNPRTIVRFNWYALDENGNVLQSGERWENEGTILHNTVRAARLKVEWYLVIDNQDTPILGETVIEATEEYQCDDDWPQEKPPVPEELSPLRHPYAWHLVAPQLQDWPVGQGDVQRFPTATLLPVPRDNADSADPYPVSFCISPYVGIDFAPAKDVVPRIIYTELLCLDPLTQTFVPVASQLYDLETIVQDQQLETTADSYRTLAETIYTEKSRGWGREIQRRLAPDTPIAVLRFRTINEALTPQAGEAALTTTYAFSLVSDLKVQERLSRHMFSIRTRPEDLRYRQGQYGGYKLPQDAQPFEIAPPQTTGVQPIYFAEQPANPNDPEVREASWPWGVSALRLSIQYTEGKRGVVGSTEGDGDAAPSTLWWQAPQHQVQFRSSTEDDRPSAGLPKKFRAPAIASLLPVLPAAPMPGIDVEALLGVTSGAGESEDGTGTGSTNGAGAITKHWQPVLPGNLRYMVLGSRAGAMFAFRNMLLRQSALSGASAGETVVSGSVPVQHRVPRPVSLPPNERPEYALQTWASRFEPQRNALVTEGPADEAFFAASNPLRMVSEEDFDPTKAEKFPAVPRRRMQVTLSSPANGAIPPGWTGEIVLDVTSDMGADWVPTPAEIEKYLRLELVQGNQTPRVYETQPADSSLLRASGSFENNLPSADTQAETMLDASWRSLFANAGVSLPENAKVSEIQPLGGVRTWRVFDVDGVPYVIARLQEPHPTVENEVIVWLHVFRQADRFKLRYRLKKLSEEERNSGIIRSQSSEEIVLRASVLYAADDEENFKQILQLPLRISDPTRFPLPLSPRFVHFEDPEYNRRLASNAATASRNVDVFVLEGGNPARKHLFTAGIATDRREYNPDSELALRYDWLGGVPFAPGDDNQPQAVVKLTRVTQEGNEFTVRVEKVKVGKLRQIKLSELRGGDGNLLLQPGDVLQLYLYVGGDVSGVNIEGETDPVAVRVVEELSSGFPLDRALDDEDYAPFLAKAVVLRVDIIEESVIPVPEAGYALLHAQEVAGQVQVECARFAWNPAAARVELISPDDLLKETVRRRAVFHWLHTVRPGRNSELAIQKVTNTGSTHFPQFGQGSD